jgi:hypothetical protein
VEKLRDRQGVCGVSDLSAFLEGAWHLSRILDDRRTKQRGRLDGLAVFTPCGARLIYRERGVLRIGAYQGRTERVYNYAFPAPGRAEVAFDDGAPFHDLDLTAGTWNADHRCREDRYQGRFRVLAPDAWQVVWRVAGPRKDQTLTTRYSRHSERLEM